ncbi:uncharacterized protein M6B38_274295 [Iris pallida]|uniref:Uncharacterized protein n=1 Tax=Iris pallida TaxID=29817 RepID=A0AAX6FK90_IRIPA|nr:uncharacterized protein M6B38_415760 [Iris pallida]KAJ6848434.1 uncharacterized protein M6B38_274295 [Iris pallida]
MASRPATWCGER